jgi:hypothetical protein
VASELVGKPLLRAAYLSALLLHLSDSRRRISHTDIAELDRLTGIILSVDDDRRRRHTAGQEAS